MHQPLPRSSAGVPPLIKRNTTLFALSQSFMGASTQLGYGMGPLMVVGLTGSASLAGLTVALFGFSRFLVAYPVGKITDTYGRKPGIQMGLGLTLLGTIIVGVAMLLHGIVALVIGMLIFGMGFNAAQQMRVAATDMFPPRLRAMALGFVAAGSLIGLVISPVLMWISEIIASQTGLEPIALPWLMVPTLILVGMVLVTFVQPDPKVIGMNLEQYYPDYTPPPKPEGGGGGGRSSLRMCAGGRGPWSSVPAASMTALSGRLWALGGYRPPGGDMLCGYAESLFTSSKFSFLSCDYSNSRSILKLSADHERGRWKNRSRAIT